MSQIIPIYIPTYISDQNYNPARVLPRLLFYNGMIDSQKWYFESGSTGIAGIAFEQNSFPYFDNYNVVSGSFPTTDSKSLLFFNEQAVYGEVPTDSLYTDYWETYVEFLYNPRTRLVNASAIIPLAAYIDMNLNDTVQFRGNMYNLRAINDYSLTTGECTIQLLGPLENLAPQAEAEDARCLFTFSSVDDSAFKFQIFTTASSYALTLPTYVTSPAETGSNFSYTASWGDGNITYGDSATSVGGSHTYTNSGSYEISITGVIPIFEFEDGGGASYRSLQPVLTSINKWGSPNINHINFYKCNKLTSVASGEPGNLTWNTTNNIFRTSSLATIPGDILKYSNFLFEAADFSSFNNCLTAVPERLFFYNRNLDNVGSAFRYSKGITTLPNQLFPQGSNYLYNLDAMFEMAQSVSTIPTGMLSPLSSSVVYRMEDFFNMLQVYPLTGSISFCTGSVQGNNISGNVDDVWNFTNPSLYTNAFNNCLGITNYASIPAGWK
jgi:hypothetical protein